MNATDAIKAYQAATPQDPNEIKPQAIILYPDPILKKHSRPISSADWDGSSIELRNFGYKDVPHLIDVMVATMRAAGGAGLAAVQIGVNLDLFIVDISPDHMGLKVFINASLSDMQGEVEFEEACLSVPGFHGTVKRSKSLTITYVDETNQPQTLQAEGVMADAIQHEFDHTRGIVYIDHLSWMKKSAIQNSLKKLRRHLFAPKK